VDKPNASLRRFGTEEHGATILEYVLMLALIALVCVGGVTAIGNMTNLFFSVANTL
jgi:pilus assembly protein Flp/PilA